MTRLLLLIAMLCACGAAPSHAETPPTYYFVFEVDETRLAERIEGEFDLDAAMESTLNVVSKRIGGGDYELERIGERRIALTLTHENAPQAARDVFGITGDLDFLLVDVDANPYELAKGNAPKGTFILERPDGSGPVALYREGGLSGDFLTDARAGIDSQTSQPVITVGFDAKGKDRLAALTRANVGKPIAIVLDDEVLSVPVINEPILGGQLQISGSFTQEQVNQLAIALRSGALPTPLRLVEERLLKPAD